MPDAEVVAPSATAPTLQGHDPSADLSALTPNQRSDWYAKGDWPESKKTDAAADSSPAEPADQAVSTETPAAASEPAPPAKNGHKGNADTRVQELLAERATWRAERSALEARLARLEQTPATQTPIPASSAAPVAEPEYKRYLKLAQAPKLDQFESIEDHAAAMALFIADQRFAERETAQREQQQQQTRATQAAEQHATLQAKFDAAKARDPEWAPKLQASRVGTIPTLDDLRAAQARGVPNVPIPSALNVLVTEIAQSPLTVELLDHFQAHPEELDAYASLPNWPAVSRALGKLEARLETPPVETKPAPKTLTDAGSPPTTLGRRPSPPVDDADAALARKDFKGYRAAMNARELAAAR